ncbi:MAG: class I SAM-dependent methyltransferase [Chloroflexi bacterium]|nr:class I SAM-dependent methyltransferase [Chloroflexota bacterium]
MPSLFFGEAQIFDKYPARYFRCEHCGFLQVEDAYWLKESYSEAITKSDLGLISRNLQMAARTQKLLLTCFEPKSKFIDYGGGYGMFVRLMRDRGFDFYRYDPLCKNLFAEGFDAKPNANYTLLTTWEVFEHLQKPLAEIETMLSFSRNLFFSTVLLQRPPQPLNDWWYYGLEHGQHISFYSLQSLHVIARKFNLKLHYSNGSLHFMGDPLINPLLIKIAFDRRFRWLRKIIAKPALPSLLESDYHIVTGKYLK